MANSILIVEDDEILADNFCTYLQRRQFDVMDCSSAEDALPIIEAQHPDLVLTDYCLPGMSGCDLISRARAMDEQLKVLLRIDSRLARLEDLLGKTPVAELLQRDCYSCQEVARLTRSHGTQAYQPFTLRLACSDGRIPEAWKRENGHWSIPRVAVERILRDGIPPERRNGDAAGAR